MEQTRWIAFDLAQPHRPILWLEDHRHAVVQLGEIRAGIGRDDHERPHNLAFLPAPALLEAGKGHRHAIGPGDRVGLLRAAKNQPPFVEGRRGHQAPAPLEGVA